MLFTEIQQIIPIAFYKGKINRLPLANQYFSHEVSELKYLFLHRHRWKHSRVKSTKTSLVI